MAVRTRINSAVDAADGDLFDPARSRPWQLAQRATLTAPIAATSRCRGHEVGGQAVNRELRGQAVNRELGVRP